MIFRKSALIASILASIAGASQSEAACFGQRRCCQSTPVVCPSCPVYYSEPQVYYREPQAYPIVTPISASIDNSNCVPFIRAYECQTQVYQSAPSAVPSARSDGQWRTYTEQVTVTRTLSDGTQVQETRDVQKQRFFSTADMVDEQSKEIALLKKQLDEQLQFFDNIKANKTDVQLIDQTKANKAEIQLIDQTKANKVEVTEALNKKADKP